jgi:hypothetical protein
MSTAETESRNTESVMSGIGSRLELRWTVAAGDTGSRQRW